MEIRLKSEGICCQGDCRGNKTCLMFFGGQFITKLFITNIRNPAPLDHSLKQCRKKTYF